ncbi:DNA primase [Halarsenatibacter silvermanii]|uniref:DNA primase n=1 Tax=Halarsenatibacter silvermanii TaxID=321763 RepID=A0A1G9JUA6_9FIRM|nr:DNA primase [Halarsenatibacter silvermanii]SDL40846.1 DNA primase [Halarsenatibacter silvermanii]
MAGINEEFIEKLKDSVDIVDLVEGYLDLEKTGKNYRALCPFHQEDTPSFTINPRKQFFYCFGCGEGGDVISFIMKMDNLSFQEALIDLSDRAGLEMPDISEKKRARMKTRERIFEINNLAARFYNYILMNKDVADSARKYLKDRGFNREQIERFNLGYAPSRWRALLRFFEDRDYSPEMLVKAGLVGKSEKTDNYYDLLRNRIIFPIFNVRDEVIGFGGRVVSSDDSPKYLNSPETPIFSKKHTLYGLNWARESMRKTNQAVVVEGYTDVLTAQSYGLENFVASLGTSFTEQQAELLARYVDKVLIAFDADTAGEAATLRGLDILREAGLAVRVIDLPREVDPDDLLRERGKPFFEDLIEDASALIDYRLDRILSQYDTGDTDEKLQAVKKALNFLATIEDSLTREAYIQKLADKVELSAARLESEVKKHIKKMNEEKNKKNDRFRKTGGNSGHEKKVSGSRQESLEWMVLAAILECSSLDKKTIADIGEGLFSREGAEVLRTIKNMEQINTSTVFSRIKESSRKQLARFLMDEEENAVSVSRVEELLDRLKDRHFEKESRKLLNDLKEFDNISRPDVVNDCLIYYNRLLKRQGGEGDEG